MHLERVGVTENRTLARTLYRWIFDAHAVVMGDMNCRWQFMIEEDAAVKATSHTHATRPSYLPGMTNPSLDKYTGKPRAVTPASFDMVVVTRPLSVELLPKQLGAKFTPCKLPRGLMQSIGWPSDHTSVIATARRGDGAVLTFATWNVADPIYFGQFWPDAAHGFDWQPESQRLDAIAEHVQQLLDADCHVVGLQEVPSTLVSRLVVLGAARHYQVQWVAAPSKSGRCPWYSKAAGRRGCSTDEGSTTDGMPPVAHDLLFAQLNVLKEPPLPVKSKPGAGGEEAPETANDEGADDTDEIADSWEDL